MERKYSLRLPPPPPPLPARPAPLWSVTRWEIEKYWRRKRMEEEDHFLAAIKAAARIRARNLSEEEYKKFEESLEEIDEQKKKDNDEAIEAHKVNNGEIRVGIKDWWTKSKYAYLNEPAIDETQIKKKRGLAYVPNSCLYKQPCIASFQATSLGVS